MTAQIIDGKLVLSRITDMDAWRIKCAEDMAPLIAAEQAALALRPKAALWLARILHHVAVLCLTYSNRLRWPRDRV